MFQEKHICVIARDVCPETNDTRKPKYCPFWVNAIPEIEKDGSGRIVAEWIYTGCGVFRLFPYLVNVSCEAAHAHAASNQARDTVNSLSSPVNRLSECFNGLVQLASLSSSNKQIQSPQSPLNIKELSE